jgi:PhzF family phenazine biosynthesis protein
MTMPDVAPDLLSVWHLDVFGRGPGGGNPCPVVLNGDDLPPAQMQALAAHFEQETVFVIRDGDAPFRLRFFVPRREVVMCVHATVAAVTVLLQLGTLAGNRATLITAAGPCDVTWDNADRPRVTVEQQPPQFGSIMGDVCGT